MKYGLKFAPESRNNNGKIMNLYLPLFADIRFQGTRMFYYTGYRIDNENFDREKQTVKMNKSGYENKRKVSYSEINRRLKNIEAALQLYFNGVNEASKEELKNVLDEISKKRKKKTTDFNAPDDFFKMAEYYLRSVKVSDARKRQIKSMINRWHDYQDAKKIKITFDTLSTEVIRDFEKSLRNGNRGNNTISTIMKIGRAFFNFAYRELRNNGKTLDNPFKNETYSVPKENYSTPIFLTIEERDYLLNLHIPIKRIREVRDMFILQCLLGMRVSDFFKLTKGHIQHDFISYIQGKVRDKNPKIIRVPLHEKAKEIIARYDMPDGRLLPFISKGRYNIYIKELFKFAKINRLVTRINPKTNNPEQIPICDIAGSHMARKTFIGGMYKRKVKDSIIGAMSGHVPGSRAFARYYNIDDEMIKEAINTI